MKKVGDLMAELGFKPEGSEGVKRAFIENLVRAAGGPEKLRPKKPVEPVQLSFNLDVDSGAPFPAERKRPAG